MSQAVYMQHLIGIDGVIADFVFKKTEAVSNIYDKATEGRGR